MSLGLDPDAVAVTTIAPRLWWRVFTQHHGACCFNRTALGNARFSPILDAVGQIIPTLYAATTPAVALMETVLHDAPWPSDGYILTLPPREQELRRMSCLVNVKPLLLADFSALGLRRLGIKKARVIEADKTHYPYSRTIAQWLYANRTDLQGILWSSRQDDRGQTCVLFEPRLRSATLHVWQEGENIGEAHILDELVELLDVLGAGLIFE